MTTNKPAWWQLYLLIPLMFGVLVLVHQSGRDMTAQSVIDTAIVLGTFGAMVVWMIVNEGAIERAAYAKETHARAKAMRKLRGWRSESFAIRTQATTADQVPLTGFGSLRNRPTVLYQQERVTPDRVRVHRRVVEKV